MNEEEAEKAKEEIISQIESSEMENKEDIVKAIIEMSPEQLEEFLRQNKSKQGKEEKQECVFCSIVQGKVPAYKIDENAKSIALLEINPLSRGHVIVVSKNHNKLPSSAFTLANKITRKLKSKLHADDVKIENIEILGHKIVTVIPIYNGKKLEKRKADEKELVLLQQKLQARKRKKKEKQKPIITQILEKAPIRFP